MYYVIELYFTLAGDGSPAVLENLTVDEYEAYHPAVDIFISNATEEMRVIVEQEPTQANFGAAIMDETYGFKRVWILTRQDNREICDAFLKNLIEDDLKLKVPEEFYEHHELEHTVVGQTN